MNAFKRDVYNPSIAAVVQQLTGKGLVEEDKRARTIRVDGHKNALMVVKSDGGFDYASTDLAALWCRFLR